MISLKASLRSFFRRREFERNLSEELRSYLDLLTDEKIARGMNAAAARHEALVETGGIEQVKEEVRDVHIGQSWDGIWKDIEVSLRSLRRSAGSTMLAIATLGLGLGATTLIFSVFYSVLLQRPPFHDPDRLVELWETRAGQGWDQASFSRANFWDVQKQNRTFESMGAMVPSNMNLTGSGDPEHLSAGVVSARFFHVLGVAPILGHDFEPLQDQPGHDSAVALLSSKLWRARFASSRAILGKTLHLDERAYTVIGVLPEGEPWLNSADIFVPLAYSPGSNRGNFEASVIGRLAPGVSISTAHADLEHIARQLSEMYARDRGMGVRIAPSSTWGATPVLRRALWVLLGAVTLLLLIACVNVANLLLAKASVRTRELRVREALGASRYRILRLVLTESLVLCFLGAGLGLLIADGGLNLIRTADLSGIPHLAEIHINGLVLLFACAATFLSGIVSGLAPAFQSSSSNIAAVLREGDRTQTAGRGQNRFRMLLVTAEVALSMILLIGAGLLIRSFGKLLTVDRGFVTANRIVASVNIPLSYDDARAASVTRKLVERVRSLPGVRAVGTVNSRPIVGWDPGMGFGAPDAARTANGDVPWASWRFISGDYFRAMGIRLLAGRRFIPADYEGKARRVIVSETVASLLWPGKDPIGRQIILWKGQSNHAAEVIGVVGNIRDHGLDAEPTRIVYLPVDGQTMSPLQVVIDGKLPASATASALRSILGSIDRTIPISQLQSMDEVVSHSLGSRQLNTLLLSMFAVLALLLSLSGIYGVLSYSVARRTSEIGIRVALGAGKSSILRLILREGMRPIAAGVLLGIGGSLALSRFLAGLLFEVKPVDAASYLSITVLIGVLALISCLLPARRALGIDPATALREA